MSTLQPGNPKPDIGQANEQFLNDVQSLLNYLDRLVKQLETTADGQSIWQAPWLADRFCQLVGAFNGAALAHAKKVKKAIEAAAGKDKELRVAYYHDQVLKKIGDHIRLLAQLLISLQHNRLPSLPGEPELSTLDAIQAIIWEISQRIPENHHTVLVPMLASQFMYVQLEYTDVTGIVGIPPYALWSLYPDLPILWHEVAGHWVAQQKKFSRLKQHAEKLQEKLKAATLEPASLSLWDKYREQYEQSCSHGAVVDLSITGGKVGLKRPNVTHRYFLGYDGEAPGVDTDFEWQMSWLGQILEDMFGLRDLGDIMKQSMDYALGRAYNSPGNIGDHKHPSPELRLAVASLYLHPGTKSSPGVDPVVFDMARVIVNYICSEEAQLANPSPSKTPIAKLVQQLTSEALPPTAAKARETMPQPTKDAEDQSIKLRTDPDIIRAFDEFKQQSWPKRATQSGTESQADIDACKLDGQSRESGGDGKASPPDELEELRRYSFVTTDENYVPADPPTIPPYPYPYPQNKGK
jgi:hypothetical protein